MEEWRWQMLYPVSDKYCKPVGSSARILLFPSIIMLIHLYTNELSCCSRPLSLCMLSVNNSWCFSLSAGGCACRTITHFRGSTWIISGWSICSSTRNCHHQASALRQVSCCWYKCYNEKCLNARHLLLLFSALHQHKGTTIPGHASGVYHSSLSMISYIQKKLDNRSCHLMLIYGC